MDTPSSTPPASPKAPPPEAVYSPEEQAAFAKAKAQSHLNPAVVREAFLQQEITVGSITLRPLNLATYMLLEQIESPLLEAMGQPEEFTIHDMAHAVYILSHDEDVVMQSLSESRKAFDLAVFKWAKEVPPPDLQELGEAITAQLAKAMATVLPTAEKKSPASPSKTTSPDPSATGSDGLSPSSTPSSPNTAEAPPPPE